MNLVYIAFGSNLGERELNIKNAISLLNEKLTIIQVSGIYETPAENMNQGHHFPFLNGVLVGETELEAEELLNFLLETEKKCGRVRTESKGHFSRKIDLDLLIFNELILDSPNLQLPHPRMHERWFVIRPMLDIDPLKIIPGKMKNIQDYYNDLTEGKEALLK